MRSMGIRFLPLIRHAKNNIEELITNELVTQQLATGLAIIFKKERKRMQPESLQNWKDRIVIDEAILTGKPVIKGTRLAVEFIIDLLAHGWSEVEILENYPGIVVEDIRACLAYASAKLHAEKG